MSGHTCPADDCDFGTGEFKTANSVRSHINAMSDDPHADKEALRAELEAQEPGDEGGDEGVESAPEGPATESPAEESGEKGEEQGGEGRESAESEATEAAPEGVLPTTAWQPTTSTNSSRGTAKANRATAALRKAIPKATRAAPEGALQGRKRPPLGACLPALSAGCPLHSCSGWPLGRCSWCSSSPPTVAEANQAIQPAQAARKGRNRGALKRPLKPVPASPGVV
ncbi:hypothetical protein ACFQFD_03505 [Halobaculum halobium]|uniref:C2H2-type domain-containing protein n=1 Tax=Halobaculum halobium TaxID=3032281 RepID=A0ABD5TAP5_9EURY